MLAQQSGIQGKFTETIKGCAVPHKPRLTDVSYQRANDSQAGAIHVERYYAQFGPMVLRRCRHLLRNEDAAMDAMQDTFVNVLRYQDRLANEAPSSLLYRMATNVCLNRIRSASRKKEFSDSELLKQIACAKAPEDRLLAANTICRLFSKHQESTRTMAVMHFLDGMTLQEVASEVGLSVSGVRKRLRALKSQLTV